MRNGEEAAIMQSSLLFVLANGAGLLLAVIILPGFYMGIFALVFAAILFSLFEVILGPLILKLAQKRMPALEGGISFVITFVGLFFTSILIDGMHIGGLINWLLASMIVWLGSLLASTVLPRFIFKKKQDQ